MKNFVRIAGITFLLFAGLSSTRASAAFFCGDICSPTQSCTRGCSGVSGVATTCGQWGCCVSNQTKC
jgi:hypothetical protein